MIGHKSRAKVFIITCDKNIVTLEIKGGKRNEKVIVNYSIVGFVYKCCYD